MIGRARALGAALFAAGALIPSPAWSAEPARPASETRSSTVDIYVDGSPTAVERVRSAAAETFGRAGLSAVVSASAGEAANQAPGRAKPLARAYVDLRNPLSPRVVVVDGQTERELARRTLEENASLETSVEAATLVLYMVVEALLTSGSAGTASSGVPSSPAATAGAGPSSSQPAPNAPPPNHDSAPTPALRETPAAKASPAPERRAPAPPESGPEPDADLRDTEPAPTVGGSAIDLQAGLFLRTSALDARHPLAGAGASLELFGRSHEPEFGALFLGAAHLSSRPSAGGARASIETYSFRVLPALRLPMTAALSAVLGVGGGVDSFSVEARSLGPGATAPSGSSALDGIVGALAGVRLRLAERLHANLNAGADLDLAPRVFVAQAGSERRVLLELGRVRPSLSIGLAFALTREPQTTTVASAR